MTVTTSLTARERVLRMIEHRDHDRVPRTDVWWPETLDRWLTEGMADRAEAAKRLNGDFGSVCWSWPKPFPGRKEVLEETATTRLIRGPMGKVERHWKDRSGTPEHVAFDCDGPEKWREVYRPALESAGMSIDPEEACEQSAGAGELFRPLRGVESFEAMRQLVGDETLLMAMVTEVDWVREMSALYTDLILGEFAAALDAGAEADAVWVYGDVGYRSGPFMSPATYRETIGPDHRRMVEWAWQRGLKFIYHTDGDVRPLLDDFEANGFDLLHPLEAKAGMDVRELAPARGERLAFLGNIDMTVAATGDRDRIEHEVVTKLEAGKAVRGYGYHSDHSVPPTVSWESYLWILELVETHGHY